MKALSKLKLLFTPTKDNDAVNKKYVDDSVDDISKIFDGIIIDGGNSIDAESKIGKIDTIDV